MTWVSGPCSSRRLQTEVVDTLEVAVALEDIEGSLSSAVVEGWDGDNRSPQCRYGLTGRAIRQPSQLTPGSTLLWLDSYH